MASTIWKGYLTFGMISVPVRLYAAARTERISFHMLHRKCGTRIRQQLWCPLDKEVVDRKDIVKGHEIEDGRYVLVEPEDLEKIEPESARTIDVLEFVKEEELDPVYLDASYYLVPEEPGEKAYYLLQNVLDDLGVDGVAKLVMHQREHIVVIRPAMGGMMLHTIFYEDEVRKVEEYGEPGKGVKVTDKELEMGRTFVKALQAKFDPARYHDQYRANVEKMLEEKAKGEAVTEVPKSAPVPVMDLMAALKASLAATRGEEVEEQPKVEDGHGKGRHRPTRKRTHESHEDFKSRGSSKAHKR
jgi:DNA end-binding protein Ku